jgi:hypothetical protein
MSFRNEDPPASLERALRAGRPQLDADVEGRITAEIPSGSRGRGIRMLTATVATTGAFGAMAMFGGMSYAIASVHHVVGGGNSTPASNEYGCDIKTSEPDHNGDLHSNCHTGSKGRGAGGDDKPGSKKG